MVCEMATVRGPGSALPKHRRPTGAKPQRGQAMIWMLGMLAASGAVMFALFNTSQTTVSKERTINAADAAALAGATAEARLLNLMAYNNRAIIANEAFLIQLLSLEGWTQYVGKTAKTFGTILHILSLIPPISAPANAAATALDKASTAADKAHDAVSSGATPVVITMLETAKSVAKLSHGAIRETGSFLAADAARAIASANRTDFGGRHDPGQSVLETPAMMGVTLGMNLTDWRNFTKIYEGSERGDAKQVLLDSRDAFTTSRPGRSWLNFKFDVIPLVRRVGLEKNGGSQLVGFDRWETQDTLELLTWTKRRPWSGWRLNPSDGLPLGWGRATADDTENKGNVWSPSRLAQRRARNDGDAHGGWSGVPSLYNVADTSEPARAGLGVDFLVAVGRPEGNDITTTSLKMGSTSTSVLGATDMPQAQDAGRHTAFAKARVSFERPQRGLAGDTTAAPLWRRDTAKEYGSLYSPYWQARLADLTVGEKTAMLAAVGLTPDYLVYTPGAQSK